MSFSSRSSVPSPSQLRAMYPYQFRDEVGGRLLFPRGWMPIVADMCREVGQVLGQHPPVVDFRWRQFKEKLGAPRYYFALTLKTSCEAQVPAEVSFDDTLALSALREKLQELLMEVTRRAEARGMSVCMACGAPGVLGDQALRLTLCPEHDGLHQLGQLRWSDVDAEGGSNSRD